MSTPWVYLTMTRGFRYRARTNNYGALYAQKQDRRKKHGFYRWQNVPLSPEQLEEYRVRRKAVQ